MADVTENCEKLAANETKLSEKLKMSESERVVSEKTINGNSCEKVNAIVESAPKVAFSTCLPKDKHRDSGK
jgi:hypothetical protein